MCRCIGHPHPPVSNRACLRSGAIHQHGAGGAPAVGVPAGPPVKRIRMRPRIRQKLDIQRDPALPLMQASLLLVISSRGTGTLLDLGMSSTPTVPYRHLGRQLERAPEECLTMGITLWVWPRTGRFAIIVKLSAAGTVSKCLTLIMEAVAFVITSAC
jgi:hypothetical protein